MATNRYTPMPEAFLSLPIRERTDILRTVAARAGRQADILEKDVWICWVLQALFAIPDRHPMAFKGGTSLSKIYRVIDRFSEDVDITLDYRAFEDDFDPFDPHASNNAIRRFSERLRSRVASYIKEVVAPALAVASEQLATAGQHRIRTGGETVHFTYPSELEPSNSHLPNNVLLEFGGRNVIDPNERHQVVPDLADLLPGLHYPRATVTVLSPVRTFWEKATLIHVECHRRRLATRPDKLARHWFDIACLASHEIGRAALADRALLAEVVRHKKIFFNASYAEYDRCLAGQLRLVPDDDQIDALRVDYNSMRHAGLLSDSVPEFATLIDSIRNVEACANGLFR